MSKLTNIREFLSHLRRPIPNKYTKPKMNEEARVFGKFFKTLELKVILKK